MSDSAGPHPAPDPLFRVVRGHPTDREIAALTVAVLALQSRPAAPAATTSTGGDGWSAYWRSVRAPLVPGPGAWRTSARR